MKRTILSLICVTTCFYKMLPQQCTQLFDGAPGCNFSIHPDTGNIWQVGTPHKMIFNKAATVPRALVTDTINNYPVNNVSRFTVTIRNYHDFYGVFAIHWKQKLDLEDGIDAGIIEYSKDFGATWNNVHNTLSTYQFYGYQPANKDTIGGEYCFTGTDTTWRDIWLCFHSTVLFDFGNDTLLVRFSLKSDSSDSGQEGWMIDNLTIHETFVHPVKEISMTEDLVVYPNTTTGIVNVEHKKNGDIHPIRQMELLDADGRLLKTYGPNYAKVVLDISNYPNGQYYLRVTTAQKVQSYKILLQRS